MKYYQAVKECHDYFTGYTTIPGELVTKRERDTMFRYLTDACFQVVEVSKKKTFRNFGARFRASEA